MVVDISGFPVDEYIEMCADNKAGKDYHSHRMKIVSFLDRLGLFEEPYGDLLFNFGPEATEHARASATRRGYSTFQLKEAAVELCDSVGARLEVKGFGDSLIEFPDRSSRSLSSLATQCISDCAMNAVIWTRDPEVESENYRPWTARQVFELEERQRSSGRSRSSHGAQVASRPPGVKDLQFHGEIPVDAFPTDEFVEVCARSEGRTYDAHRAAVLDVLWESKSLPKEIKGLGSGVLPDDRMRYSSAQLFGAFDRVCNRVHSHIHGSGRQSDLVIFADRPPIDLLSFTREVLTDHSARGILSAMTEDEWERFRQATRDQLEEHGLWSWRVVGEYSAITPDVPVRGLLQVRVTSVSTYDWLSRTSPTS